MISPNFIPFSPRYGFPFSFSLLETVDIFPTCLYNPVQLDSKLFNYFSFKNKTLRCCYFCFIHLSSHITKNLMLFKYAIYNQHSKSTCLFQAFNDYFIICKTTGYIYMKKYIHKNIYIYKKHIYICVYICFVFIYNFLRSLKALILFLKFLLAYS